MEFSPGGPDCLDIPGSNLTPHRRVGSLDNVLKSQGPSRRRRFEFRVPVTLATVVNGRDPDPDCIFMSAAMPQHRFEDDQMHRYRLGGLWCAAAGVLRGVGVDKQRACSGRCD